MVRDFGLSNKLGPVSYSDPPDGLPGFGARAYSQHTQWLVDQEVTDLLTSAETRARDLLTSHQDALSQLTTALLEQETITGDQVRALAAASPATPPTSTPAASPAALPAATPASLPAALPAGTPAASHRP
jgi:cell division protease FtsH